MERMGVGKGGREEKHFLHIFQVDFLSSSIDVRGRKRLKSLPARVR